MGNNISTKDKSCYYYYYYYYYYNYIKREEEEIQPESDGCRDGNFYTTGVWYKRGHGTQLSELFKNSRK